MMILATMTLGTMPRGLRQVRRISTAQNGPRWCSREVTCRSALGVLAEQIPGSTRTVDLATVPDGNDEDDQHAIVDVVDDAKVTRSHAPLTFAADEPTSGRRSRIFSEQRDNAVDAVARTHVEFAKLPSSGG